jgi:hypothetical protein
VRRFGGRDRASTFLLLAVAIVGCWALLSRRAGQGTDRSLSKHRDSGASGQPLLQEPVHGDARVARVRAAPGGEIPRDAEVPAVLDLTVHDCWDGCAVPSLRLICAGSGGAARTGSGAGADFVTDLAGRVTVPEGVAMRLEAAGDEWEVVRPPDASILRERLELWVFRRIQVRARVLPGRETVTVDPKRVEVFGRATPAIPVFGPTEEPFHRSSQWLSVSGLEGIGMRLSRVAGDECFEGLLPRIPDLGVRAFHPGCRPAIAMIPPPQVESGGPVEVELRLMPSVRVRGRVVTTAGLPVGKVTVQLFTAIETDSTGYQLLWLRGGSFTAEAIPPGQFRACLRRRAVTDDRGWFEIEVGDTEGLTRAIVWQRGFAPEFLDLGSVRESQDGVCLVLRPASGRGQVAFLLDGRPVANHQLFLSDLTRRDMQPAVMLPTGPSGEVSAEWFEVGREYGLGFSGPLSSGLKDRFLEWRGQAKVELADLPLATDVLSR